MNTALVLLFAYLCGSIPTGYWVVKALKGIDLRKIGSGSTGTTNVLRVTGKKAAAFVFFVDIAKGYVPVWVAIQVLEKGMVPELQNNPMLAPIAPWLPFAAGIVALIGHSKSIFLGFQGGKSAATGLGIMFAMNPVAAFCTFLIFATVTYLSKFVSLASMTAVTASAILMYLFEPQRIPYITFCAVGALYVVYRHKANIKRLIAGTEPRIGQKAEQPSKQAQP